MPKWFSFALLLCAAFVAAQFSAAQDNPSPSAAPESSAQGTQADSALALAPDPPAEGAPPDPIPVQASVPVPVPAPSEWRILGSQWKSLAPDLLHEQKRMWLFPTSIVRGHHLKPTLALLGATALHTTGDAHHAPRVRTRLRPLGGFNNAFAGYNTATATEAFASAFYIVAIRSEEHTSELQSPMYL